MNEQNETIIQENQRKINRSINWKKQGILLVLSGSDLGKSFLLDRESSLLGRGENCDIRLDDEEISKEHCLIKAEQGYFFIEDSASRNGTFLEGKKLKKKKLLTPFDRILVGKTILRFFMEESL